MDKTLSLDGTPIAYRRRGDGPPVVLVGGALSTTADGEPLAALLEPRFTVVTYDRRGRGASGDTGPYAVRREIEDLAAVTARAGERVSVFGMLSGGALALEAQAAGVPMNRLAVFEPPYTPDLRFKRRCTAELQTLLAAGDRSGAVALHLSRTGVPEATVARMRRAPLWAALVDLAPTLAYDDTLLGTGEIPDRFTAVTARTLVLTGGFSTSRAHETTLALTAALPRARHRTLTGQTREVAPQALAPVLTDFFTRDVLAHLTP
ncbi:alpha/beta fold hydrolase [Streptomyces sp. NRRL WC-3549]|uniref:alpha/beta fold hydrolase n=1 Tax=Streptomyces sp. NRRL WC-3549 TaxID=1463925 RepID=UPI0004C73AD3|nr:alpha/beta hydrolase [Streptomyces sp. NRRL WC-3549]